MTTRVGINGFGRIGRQVLRTIMERHADKLEVVAYNDRSDAITNAHLFKYDSTYGIYSGTVEATDSSVVIDGNEIVASSILDPSNLSWGDQGVDIVIECTGAFTNAGRSADHLEAGAKKVIISAPARNEDVTLVLGVNEGQYDPDRHHIVSNASCTTNCVAPMAKVLNDSFGIEQGLMTTIHAYTNDQRILDGGHKDLRRARAGAVNIIPTTTGAAKAVGIVLPELEGKLNGMAMRVPTPTGSVTDLVATLEQSVSSDDVNAAFREAASNGLDGVLEYSEEPLVSSDIVMNPHSCILDALSTMTIGRNMVKVVGWYDNEWGYSCRTADLAAFIVDKGI